ncbi:MAG: hypothetical protein WCF44_02450 [Candidatus Methylophosphatis roskildensis]
MHRRPAGDRPGPGRYNQTLGAGCGCPTSASGPAALGQWREQDLLLHTRVTPEEVTCASQHMTWVN